MHHIDAPLYLEGLLQKADLLTLRKGELVLDNVQNRVISLRQEVVRVRSQRDSRTCIFFESEQNACSIYEHRPWECRALKCWDSSEMEMAYEMQRLSRFDLIAKSCALGEIIQDHEENCSYAEVQELVSTIKQDQKGDYLQRLASVLEYDLGLRRQMEEKAGASKQELEFLLGRSLLDTLPAFGLEVQSHASGYRFREKAL